MIASFSSRTLIPTSPTLPSPRRSFVRTPTLLKLRHEEPALAQRNARGKAFLACSEVQHITKADDACGRWRRWCCVDAHVGDSRRGGGIGSSGCRDRSKVLWRRQVFTGTATLGVFDGRCRVQPQGGFRGTTTQCPPATETGRINREDTTSNVVHCTQATGRCRKDANHVCGQRAPDNAHVRDVALL